MNAAAMPVREPAKELRFTRSRQAVVFWIAAAVLAVAAVVLAASGFCRNINPELPHPAWAVLPAAAVWPLARLAVRCTRHAYLILTPLGIEIFPLLRPAHGMNLVTWHEIHSVEHQSTRARLILHFNPEKTAGIVLSLAPVRRDRRDWLAHAVEHRLATQSAANEPNG